MTRHCVWTSHDIETGKSGNCGTTVCSLTAFRSIVFFDSLLGATDMEGIVICDEPRGQNDNIEWEFLAFLCNDVVSDYGINTIPIESHVRAMQRLEIETIDNESSTSDLVRGYEIMVVLLRCKSLDIENAASRS